jgi:cysteine desulfuration protein SufE|tara:strand:+ start:448 stop:849 length:402 start_codon:yes stop_codon:yes gene_type:complete
MIQSKIKTWADDLSMLEGQERLSYLVDLARRATTLPSELRTDDRLVPGCISKIWVEVGLKENGINIYYDSDALIPKGITTIVCDIFTGSNKQEALDMKIEDLEPLGFTQLVTPQRRNGLYNLIGVIQSKIERL